ncbi:murein L,D-transpeptidase family protein [Rhizobium sp. S152]|uniref:L,D-transpeptidase family protein n=1 Tax=Rhizobium sp. S152 TaxID=3055038 RepID=UPI0025AA2C60|nr:murein L,D-transpeptidase family protein [Rhizobium sp. S152]MDM9627241.1 murein L,D-transpeptidase family protein [Rhizobium sp. S152]
MRIRHFAYVSLIALALTGCNDALDTTQIDLSSVKNKVEQPLPPRILNAMAAKGMDRNSPILIRIFKEEGQLEVWKAKTDNRFDKIADYKICAWSGRLGPKVKQGDRQAPEGFYNLTRANLNPNSKYYLAINTGFPNKYDAVNGRTGTDLMIHGACSSSGCYSMTDQQVLEIYAFARDAFKGGQTGVQLQAFPFRMTAENMFKHRMNENIDFWKMLKVGYDNFEVTKRPPDVNVCEKKYVFNQQSSGAFSPAGKCPEMSTPPALASALSSYQKTYDLAYTRASKEFDGMAWYDPSEAERKAVVAKTRKGRELAYAPTGTSLEAGRMMKVADLEGMAAAKTATTVASNTAPTATPAAEAPATAAATDVALVNPASVPVPTPNPMMPQSSQLATAYAPAEQAESVEVASKKPFWKFWGRD